MEEKDLWNWGGWEEKCPLNKHLSFVEQFYQSSVGGGPWVYLWQWFYILGM